MIKTFGRILIVILLAVILSTGIYFALNTGSTSQIAGTFEQANRPAFQNSNGITLPGDGSNGGFRRDEGGSNGAAWLDILKNLSIVAIATLIIVVIQKVLASEKVVSQTIEIR
jgi:hypothetical protein